MSPFLTLHESSRSTYRDFSVHPHKEAETIRYFETVYRPTAMKFKGYIDLLTSETFELVCLARRRLG